MATKKRLYAPNTRKFLVYLDRKVPGEAPAGVIVEVQPDEDPDEACKEALDSLIENELYTGWNEATEEDLAKYG